jgi:hypothetical protein
MNMKKVRAILVVSLLLVVVMAASAAHGHHRDPELTLSATEVTVGTEVTLTATHSATGDIQIEQCLDGGAPVPWEACGFEGSGQQGRAAVTPESDTAAWVEVAAGLSPLEFNYTPVVAGAHGFRARSAHDADEANLTVNPGTEDQRHNGCNGIENARERVSNNGKAKEKLDEIANRFNCDD